MHNGIILQIQGLGVPVRAPTTTNTEGTEVRWSSDPDVPHDAPAHLLVGADELKRFVELAVPRRFAVASKMAITHVTIEPGQTSMTRSEAQAAGVNPDNWDHVRVAIVISGNSARGPVMDDIEWFGTREEYAEGAYLQEGLIHAQRRGIKGPSIFTHFDHECGHILRAAEFITEFRRQLKPSLRAADVVVQALQSSLINMNLENINPDRAAHYLREIQHAMLQANQQKLRELEATGRIDVGAMRKAQDDTDALAETPARSSGPKLH